MFTPNLSLGGAERWVVSLIRHSDPTRVQWTGVVVSGWGGLHPAICEELRDVCRCPIYSEPLIRQMARKQQPTPQALAPECEQYLTRCDSIKQAVARAARDADVLMAWGSPKYAEYLRQPFVPRHMVLVSHSSHHAPQQIDAPGHCRLSLAAVSAAACKPFIPGVGVEPTQVIYNGVQVDRLQQRHKREAIRARWQVHPEAKVLGYVGRISGEKNPLAAVQAVRELQRRGDRRWVAVYHGSRTPGHQRLAEPDEELYRWALVNPHHVLFREPTQEMGDVYAGLDALMLASHSEAFSLTLLEAMYCGVPVVATPVGSVPELEAKYGELVVRVPPQADDHQLAEACCQAVSVGHSPCVVRAQGIVQDRFTATRMAADWAAYLETVVQPRSRKTLVLDL